MCSFWLSVAIKLDANARGMAITAGPRFRSYVRRRDACAFLAPFSDSSSANSSLPNLAIVWSVSMPK